MKSPEYGFLSPEEILSLFRTQKHDYLNHLQVILGFLQIGRQEKALEYTREIIDSVQSDGKVMKINLPGISLFLMEIMRESHTLGVKLELTVSTLMEECSGEEDILAILQKIWSAVRGQLMRQNYNERHLAINIGELDHAYIITFSFSPCKGEILEEERDRIIQMATFNGFKADFCTEARGSYFTLEVSKQVKIAGG